MCSWVALSSSGCSTTVFRKMSDVTDHYLTWIISTYVGVHSWAPDFIVQLVWFMFTNVVCTQSHHKQHDDGQRCQLSILVMFPWQPSQRKELTNIETQQHILILTMAFLSFIVCFYHSRQTDCVFLCVFLHNLQCGDYGSLFSSNTWSTPNRWVAGSRLLSFHTTNKPYQS